MTPVITLNNGVTAGMACLWSHATDGRLLPKAVLLLNCWIEIIDLSVIFPARAGSEEREENDVTVIAL